MAKLLAVVAILVATAVAGPAHAVALMVAGWDFSQYVGDALLSIDGVTFTDTLAANYSDLDPTFGAGAESSTFGTMHLDGQFGSTDSPLDFFNDPFVPSAAVPGSLISNRSRPGRVNFDSQIVLQGEGQVFFNPLVMTALAPSVVVFEADLSSVPVLWDDWQLTFGGATNFGSSALGIEFSTDGLVFSDVGSVTLAGVDALFGVSLGGAPSDHAYVRLSFGPNAPGQQPFIDNVAISATFLPEPGTALLLLATLALVPGKLWSRIAG